MKQAWNFILYLLLAAFVLLADRITKVIAISKWATEQIVTPYLSFHLTYNRGISWGLFNSSDAITFIIVTCIILLATAILIYYSYNRLRLGFTLYGEVLVIAGSLSNLIDRFLYGGVADFILLHFGNYSFPYFNIADAAISLGVFIMFLQLIAER